MTNKNNRPTKQVQQTISHSISLQFENGSSTSSSGEPMKGRKTWTKRKKSIQNDDIDGGGDNNVWAPNKSNSIVANPCRVYVCDSQKHTHPHIHTHIQQQQQHTISQMEQNQIYTRNIWYIGNVVWHNITQQRNEEKKAPQKPNAQERRDAGRKSKFESHCDVKMRWWEIVSRKNKKRFSCEKPKILMWFGFRNGRQQSRLIFFFRRTRLTGFYFISGH